MLDVALIILGAGAAVILVFMRLNVFGKPSPTTPRTGPSYPGPGPGPAGGIQPSAAHYPPVRTPYPEYIHQPVFAPPPAAAPPGLNIPNGEPTTILGPAHTGDITLVNAANHNEQYPLTPGDQHLGRDPNCQIFLPDRAVSNRHAVIRISGGSVTLFDDLSTNGTYVNGRPVHEPYSLALGDKITVGETTLILHGEAEIFRGGNATWPNGHDPRQGDHDIGKRPVQGEVHHQTATLGNLVKEDARQMPTRIEIFSDFV